MKVAILSAGDNRKYFPFIFNKPKCLYHQNGIVQLERVIQDVLNVVNEEDIIVVGGYKYKYIKRYLKKNHPNVEFRVNDNYLGPAIYSFRKAAEQTNDDIVFMFGDESISIENIKRISLSTKQLSILYHDNYYYYSLGIMKLSKESQKMLFDDKYLNFEYIKQIYKFANGKEFEGGFLVNSGICIGYMMIDMITKIGKIEKIEYPAKYKGNEIDFFHYNPETEYYPDLDNITVTDEYKHNFVLRLYNKLISNPIKRFLYHFQIGTWKR